jgi:nephrocystin-3
MHEERDILVKKTFPELRRRCRERSVELVSVDLRWGVTKEEAERGEVLPICLAEIESCRPYFIGLLAERYGWVPDRIDPALIDEQPWLEEHREKSLTELEILHGVLRNPEMTGRSFFYLRDPAYLTKMPPDKRQDFECEDEVSRKKLCDLKRRILVSGCGVYVDYPEPKAACERILEDLWEAINSEYPEGAELAPLEQEALEHEFFAASRTRLYIGRKEYFDRLDNYVEISGPPLVILGESGCGKSALIANWAERYQETHPGICVIQHYIGSSAKSTDYVALLHRLMTELKDRFDLDEDVPTSKEQIREEFPSWLASVSAKNRVIIILDGLNQLEDVDEAPGLSWLPKYFPDGVRLISSTLPGRTLSAVEKRQWLTFTVEGFDPEERETYAAEYLQQYGKKLNSAQMARVVSADQTGNPLYLRTLLEELRVFGIYEKIDERIGYYLEAQDPKSLYIRILDRLSDDYEEQRPGLVKDSTSLLWAARRGLAENELLDLLGPGSEPLPQAVWSPLYLSLQEALVSKSGLLNYFHDYMRQAVYARHICSEACERALHQRLADYFGAMDLNTRKAEEYPWQLLRAGSLGELKEAITDPGMFLVLQTYETKYELLGYWVELGDIRDMPAAYRRSIGDFKAADEQSYESLLERLLSAIPSFFEMCGQFEEAESFYRQALERNERLYGSDHPEVAASAAGLASVLTTIERNEEAEVLARRVLEISEQAYGPDHPEVAASLSNLASILQSDGRDEEAEALARRALNIAEGVFGPTHPNVAPYLNNLANILSSGYSDRKAEALLERALETFERAYGSDHPKVASVLSNLAGVFIHTFRYDKAEATFQRVLAVSEKAYGPDHPIVAQNLNNLASLLFSTERYDEARALSGRALTINKTAFGEGHAKVADNLVQLGVWLNGVGNRDEAMTFINRAIGIYGHFHEADHPKLAKSLRSVAGVLDSIGRNEEAEMLARRALKIAQASYGMDDLRVIRFLEYLAEFRIAAGAYEEAEDCFQRSLRIVRKEYGANHPKVAGHMSNWARALAAVGQYDDAAQLLGQALEINEEAYGVSDPSILENLKDLADVLIDAGRSAEAEPLMLRAFEIEEQIYKKRPLRRAESLIALIGFYCDSEQCEELEKYANRLIDIYDGLYRSDDPKIPETLRDLSQLLSEIDKHETAERTHRLILKIQESADPSDVRSRVSALNNLSYCLIRQRKWSEAEDLLLCATRLIPTYPNAYWWLAEVYRNLDRMGDRDKEAEALERYLALGPHREEYGQQAALRLRDLKSS